MSSLLIIGTGSVGSRHLKNAAGLGLSDLSVLRTGSGATTNPLPQGIRVESGLERALQSGVTAVVVANPTSKHVACALAAARSGCHLLIEKPLSHELTGIDDLVAEVADRRLVAMVGY